MSFIAKKLPFFLRLCVEDTKIHLSFRTVFHERGIGLSYAIDATSEKTADPSHLSITGK